MKDIYDQRRIRGIRVASKDWASLRVVDRPIVLVGGFGAGLEFLIELDGLLSGPETPTALVDVPGFGDSPVAYSVSDLEHVASDLREVISDLDLSGIPILVGQSGGGLFSAVAFRKQPKRCAGVVLLGGAQYSTMKSMAQPVRSAVCRPSALALMMFTTLMASIRSPVWLTRVVLRSRLGRTVTLWPYSSSASALDYNKLVLSLRNSGRSTSLAVAQGMLGLEVEEYLDSFSRLVFASVSGSRDRYVKESDLAEWRARTNLLSSTRVPGAGHWAHLDNPAATRIELLRAIELLRQWN